jgi:hypothetical protein
VRHQHLHLEYENHQRFGSYGIIFIIINGVGLNPLGTAASSGLLYKPQMID